MRITAFDITLCVLVFLLVNSMSIVQWILIPGLGGLLSIIGTIILVFNRNKLRSTIIVTAPIYLWALLMLYHGVNLLLLDLNQIYNEWFSFSGYYNQVLILIILSCLYQRNKNITFITTILSFYFFLLTVKNFSGLDENTDRLNGFLYTTQIGQLGGLACILISLYIVILNKRIYYCLLYIFPISIALLTQSRNALFPIMFSVLILVYKNLINLKLWHIIIYVVLAIIGYNYLTTTDLFVRASESSVEGVWETGTFLDYIFGDRALYYVMGYMNFLDSPINGIGIYNFMDYNKFTYPLHGEFISHWVEGGLIGALLYISFVYQFIKYLKRDYSIYNIHLNVMIFAFATIIILGFTTREYPFIFFFVVYGIILGFINERINKQEIEK